MSGLHFDSLDGWIRITEKNPVEDGWYRVLFGDLPEGIPDEENAFYEGIEMFVKGEWYNEPQEFLIAYKPEPLEKFEVDK